MSLFRKGGGGGGMQDMIGMVMLQQMQQQQAQVAQQQAISLDKQRGVIQQDMSQASTNLLRDFGRRQAMAGSQAIATPVLA